MVGRCSLAILSLNRLSAHCLFSHSMFLTLFCGELAAMGGGGKASTGQWSALADDHAVSVHTAFLPAYTL